MMLELANCTKLSNKGGKNWNTLSFHGLIRKWQIVLRKTFCRSYYSAVNIFMKALQSRASPLWALLIWLIAVCQPSAKSLSCSLQGKNPIFLLLWIKTCIEIWMIRTCERNSSDICLRLNTCGVNAHNCLPTTYSLSPLVLCSSIPNSYLPSQIFRLITDLINSQHFFVSCNVLLFLLHSFLNAL